MIQSSLGIKTKYKLSTKKIVNLLGLSWENNENVNIFVFGVVGMFCFSIWRNRRYVWFET